MKKYKYLRLLPMIIVIFCIIYFYLYRYVYLNKKYFENHQIKAKIVRIYNYENKSLEFYYNEANCITSSSVNNDTLKIGDSISKDANTVKFKIYRRNPIGEYEYYKTYNADK